MHSLFDEHVAQCVMAEEHAINKYLNIKFIKKINNKFILFLLIISILIFLYEE